VFDGHGGKYCSRFLEKHLPELFCNKLVQYPLKEKFVNNSFKFYQNILKTEHFKYAQHCGSTCLIVINYEKDGVNYLNVINSGDSRCVLCKNNIGISLTKDHKPNNFEESKRIKNLGGKIYYDGYDWRILDLSVSRAFGDISAEPYVTCEPDLFKYKLNKYDKFIVIACDGLWDVMTNEEVVNFILHECYDDSGKRIKDKIAKKLADKAIQQGSTDNVTIIVVFFS